MRLALIFALVVGLQFASTAQKKYAAQWRQSEIKIDGLLNEPDWQTAVWADDFSQHEPSNGEAASQRTSFALRYDKKMLYVAIVAYDSEPEKIVERLSRRDTKEGDFVEVSFDSYFDHRTAFEFTVSAAGVKADALITNDGDSQDDNWNAVWMVKTSVNSEGWVAEIAIPMNQLRFDAKADVKTWGIQVVRHLFRKGEYDIWANFTKEETGWVQHFGQLTDLKDIDAGRQIEVLPYALTKLETYEKEPENPFRSSGHEWQNTLGMDSKLGITNNLTLDLTINPDFGQVEADPSEVNLSGYETFFQEKRPFFVEGGNITRFNLSSFGGSFARDNLFYSRRIGRSPSYYPDVADNEYVDMPNNSRIVAAMKLSGKTAKGVSVGIIESVTRPEKAVIKSPDLSDIGSWLSREEEVEPLTNYTVARVQKDIEKGDMQLGAIFTSTNRRIDDDNLDFLHKNAYTGGIDFTKYWKNRKYFFKANAAYSYVEGSEEAISETQMAHRRYYQRPDADYLEYDPTRTHLSGHGGELSFGKSASKGWRYILAGTWRSPGFETNDIGYLRLSDRINELFWIGYRWSEPVGPFNSVNIGFAQWQGWNFGGDPLYWGLELNFNFNFKNYWYFGTGFNYDGPSVSMSELRGGPALQTNGGLSNWNNISTDSRKKLVLELGSFHSVGGEHSYRTHNYWGGLSYRPLGALKLSVNSEYSYNHSQMQYVEQFESDELDTKYMFASIERRTMAVFFRIDLSLTPDLSIQYFGQPFVASGAYSQYKTITNPAADNLADRYRLIPENELSYDAANELYTYSTQGQSYEFATPDFNSKYFLSNLVIRWEFSPGSALYVVWSQNRSDYVAQGNFKLQSDLRQLFQSYPGNIFLLKLSYRLPL